MMLAKSTIVSVCVDGVCVCGTSVHACVCMCDQN